MPNAYSLDLRLRVVAYVDEGHTFQEAAETFKVSFSAVRDWIRRRDKSGSLERDPHGGGQRPAFDEDSSELLRRLVTQYPDKPNKELAEMVANAGGPKVDPSTISRQLKRLGISRKKNAQSRRAR